VDFVGGNQTFKILMGFGFHWDWIGFSTELDWFSMEPDSGLDGLSNNVKRALTFILTLNLTFFVDTK